MSIRFRAKFISGGLCALVAITGCGKSVHLVAPDATVEPDTRDLTFLGFGGDDIGAMQNDLAVGGDTNLCGDHDNAACLQTTLGPPDKPFPLKSDAMRDTNEDDTGVGRDASGYLALDQTHAAFAYLWIANSEDWGRGTVSKIDSKKVREVARYQSVTCFSNPMGSRDPCDGTKGCCAGDDFGRWTARQAKQMQPGHQAVQTTSNNPSRTAIDFNGDMFVSNRAFGGQSAVTKVANDVSECKDYNKNKKLETSSDVNADGLIQTDCNNNGVPDDVADVKATPCANGLRQEFYGLDDECILWTTNTNSPDKWGRPLALGPGTLDTGPSDAWAGSFQDGKFFRLDGTTGQTKAVVDFGQLPNSLGIGHPYGGVVDAKGILWVALVYSGLFAYADTANPAMIGATRAPGFATDGYGIGLDRDQNVWEGGFTTGNGYRYTPDRTNGFKNLGMGYWTQITNPGGAGGASSYTRGVAADSRTANTYWVWMARHSGHVVRIPASTIPLPKGMDTMVDGSMYPVIQIAGTETGGAGVDTDQNVWGISSNGSVATRAIIDKNGNITKPDINAAPIGKNLCPAGDRCVLMDRGAATTPYTYSDFTGFGLRNFTNPKGSYTYIIKGCDNPMGDTEWYGVTWDSDVPPNTKLTVKARSGNSTPPDQTWGAWTTDFSAAPADLRNVGFLAPNDKADDYLQVEFDFATALKNSSPKLKSFSVAYKCGTIG